MTNLLISEIFPPKTGGSGRWFWEVYSRLPHEDALIAAGEDPRQNDFDRTHHLRIARLSLSLPAWGLKSWHGLTGYARAFRRLRRLVRGNSVSQVHAARILPEGVMAWCLKRWFGLPYLCYVHGEDVTCASESRELSWLSRRVVTGARFLIANSRNTARLAQECVGASPERTVVLHPGVDTRRFRPAPRDSTVRARLGWGQRPVVLTVGRLQKRKGQDQMIHALKAIRQAVPDVLYAILGDGEERAGLEELVRREALTDHVQFLGELSDADLIAAYQQCDLFALPNRQVGQDIEGFGMVLLEAQACGKPVIAGTSGGTAETMRIPETGRVVDCTTPVALSELVAQWLADVPLRERMGREARAWAVQKFDWSSLSREAQELFRRAATPSEGHAAHSSSRAGPVSVR